MYDIQANLKTWRHMAIASSKIFRVTITINPGGDKDNIVKHIMVAAEAAPLAHKMIDHLFNDCPHNYTISSKLEKFYIPKVWASDGVSRHHIYWRKPKEMNKSILWGRRNPSWEEVINL